MTSPALTIGADRPVAAAAALSREAAGQGAAFIATPENTTLMAPDGGAKFEKSFTQDSDPALPAFRMLAEELGIWLLIGSLALQGGAEPRPRPPRRAPRPAPLVGSRGRGGSSRGGPATA